MSEVEEYRKARDRYKYPGLVLRNTEWAPLHGYMTLDVGADYNVGDNVRRYITGEEIKNKQLGPEAQALKAEYFNVDPEGFRYLVKDSDYSYSGASPDAKIKTFSNITQDKRDKLV
jgi:hypothetical protein